MGKTIPTEKKTIFVIFTIGTIIAFIIGALIYIYCKNLVYAIAGGIISFIFGMAGMVNTIDSINDDK